MLVDCIRHGMTASNLAHRLNASPDEPLLPEQAQALRRLKFDAAAYDRVFVSTMHRCRETAECLGLKDWIAEPRIAELGFGVFAGLTLDECAERFADHFAPFRALDGDHVIPEGESRAAHLQRVMSWLEETARAGWTRVLAVSHGGTIDFLYRLATDHPVHGGETVFAGPNACLSRFEVEWPKLRLVSFGQPL